MAPHSKTQRRGGRNPIREELQETVQFDLELLRNLPSEIIYDILTRLPLKSLSYFRWFSKSWYNTITSTQFAIKHHLYSIHNSTSPCVLLCNKTNFALVDHQLFDDHQIHVGAVNLKLKEFHETFPGNCFVILGSVNGMVCFCTRRQKEAISTLFYVCNPITQEHVVLPKSPKCGMTHDVAGFGFDSSSNQYKVIRIFSQTAEAEIYTLGSGSWRKIENIPYKSIGALIESGVLVNESLHWFTAGSVSATANQPFVILSFNLTTEESGVINLPPGVFSRSCDKYLSVIENRLCIASSTFEFETNIWVMMDYGVEEPWSRQYVFKDHILSNTYFGPFEMIKMKNGEFLLWGFKGKNKSWPMPTPLYQKYLHYFDSQTKRPIKVQSDLDCWEPFVFRGSLLSPKSIEGSTNRWELINPDAKMVYLPHPKPADGLEIMFTTISCNWLNVFI